MLDLLLINPSSRARTYGELAASLAGIEPPFWAGLLASFVRQQGFTVQIIDADALGLSPTETAQQAKDLGGARLTMIIVQGANPSASSTPKMPATRALLHELKALMPEKQVALAGIHPSALPENTLWEEECDFVVQGEPFYPTLVFLDTRDPFQADFWIKTPRAVVSGQPGEPLKVQDYPDVAWDLLPMDRYRCHNWQALPNLDVWGPYAVLYTSLGCPYACTFCDIHSFFSFAGIRYRPVADVIRELDNLTINYGVRRVKIMDEMFALNEERVTELCQAIRARRYNLDMWAYARVDTVTPRMLAAMKEAGINWVGFGLEAGSPAVRRGVGKKFTDQVVERAVEMTREAGLYNMPAFIYGLPDDDMDSLRATLAMAEHYNFEYVNFYCAAAYPGSKLYEETLAAGVPLPSRWEAYSQLHYEFIPLPTKHLAPREVLKFRDYAFDHYFSRPEYLSMIRSKFGDRAVEHIKELLTHKLKRRLLENAG